MTAAIAFDVRGLPVPQGALVRSPSGGLYHRGAGALGDWRHAIATECRHAMGTLPLLDGPVRVSVTFRLPRPKNQLNASGSVKLLAPLAPATRPDVDKLLRAVLDAITGVAITDDAQVVDVHAHKGFADIGGPGAEIHVAEYLP